MFKNMTEEEFEYFILGLFFGMLAICGILLWVLILFG